jgi:hypothetical protein
MRDATHDDFIERWAAYMKANPDKWKVQHTAFINAQFAQHRRIIKHLLSQPGGAERVIELYNIQNKAVCARLRGPVGLAGQAPGAT